jgi:hypothetical protein
MRGASTIRYRGEKFIASASLQRDEISWLQILPQILEAVNELYYQEQSYPEIDIVAPDLTEAEIRHFEA